MFSHYDLPVRTTVTFLKLLGVKVNNATVNETLQDHPDWPSLLCISDSLQRWNIPNAAGKLQSKEIDQLPTPFIAGTWDAESTVVVTQVSDTTVSYYSPDRQRLLQSDRASFINNWTGIYLIAEPDKASGEENYRKNKRKIATREIIPTALLIALTAISFPRNADPTIYAQWGVYIAGLTISALLLWYEIDRNNPLLKKMCTGLSKGSCEAVLTSQKARLLGSISWSEIGFFYFAGSLLALLFVPGAAQELAWLSLLAMPYIIFSVSYQWLVIKKWCVLCLAVQGLLLISGIATLTGPYLRPVAPPAARLFNEAACLLLPVLSWYSLKPYCLRLQQAVTVKREHLRLKFNTEIFDSLLKNQKAITSPVEHLGIDLGKANAKHSIIKICNPYCGPCAGAHARLERLLEENDDLRVKIIFTATTSSDDFRSKPVRHLMAITEQQDETLTKKALDDWYLSKQRDYDQFAAKYPMNGELRQQDHKLEAMSSWCREMGLVATPTIFLDGYQLPDAYSIEDLEYFLLA